MTRPRRPGVDPAFARSLWITIAVLGGVLLAASIAGFLALGKSYFVLGIVPSALTMLVGIYRLARPNE